MDNYYTKYLKYKNKYLELKRANGAIIGGVGSGGVGSGVIGSNGVVISGGNLGTKPCPTTFGVFDFTLMSVWDYLRKYDCTFMTLLDKIPKKVEAITYDYFLRTNRENPTKMITVQNLRERGFTKKFLLKKGFLEQALNEVWLPLEQLQTLKRSGHSAIEIYIKDTQEPNLINISKEIADGKKLADFIVYDDRTQWSSFRYPIRDLRYFFSIKDFKEAYPQMCTNNGKQYKTPFYGYMNDGSGNDSHNLRQIFDDSEMRKIVGFITELEEKDDTVQLRNLRIGIYKLKSYGYSATELKNAGYSAKELKDAGYTPQELREAGYDEHMIEIINVVDIIIAKINEAGIKKDTTKKVSEYSAKDLKDAGYSAKELKDAGYSAKELKDAGYSAKELKDAGYNQYIIEIIDKKNKNGLHEIPHTLGAIHYIIRDVTELKHLKDAGYTVNDLKYLYSLDDFMFAGFTDEELKKGFTDEKLKEEFIEAVLVDQKLRMAVKSSSS
jgi:ribosomal protein L13E